MKYVIAAVVIGLGIIVLAVSCENGRVERDYAKKRGEARFVGLERTFIALPDRSAPIEVWIVEDTKTGQKYVFNDLFRETFMAPIIEE